MRQEPAEEAWEYTAVGADPENCFDVGGGVGKAKNGRLLEGETTMKIHGECLTDSREGELPMRTLATFEIRFPRSRKLAGASHRVKAAPIFSVIFALRARRESSVARP
jgi:hypothetical protein